MPARPPRPSQPLESHAPDPDAPCVPCARAPSRPPWRPLLPSLRPSARPLPCDRRGRNLPRMLLLLAALAGAQPQAGADGLRWPAPGAAWTPSPPVAASGWRASAPAAEDRWSPWQGRIGLALGDEGPGGPAGGGSGLRLQGMRLLGDYYFSPGSGFHATGGVISGPLARPWGGAPAVAGGGLTLSLHSPRWGDGLAGEPAGPAARPYVGAGYSLGGADGRWSFSADIGLVARSPGTAGRWGPDAAGWTSLGEGLSRWQVQPLLQLGVSVAF